MSPNGALVEGAVIPAPGTKVRLCRGSLGVTGVVVWCNDTRAGLAFQSSVSVSDWLPVGTGAAQQRVDEVVTEAKASILNHTRNDAPELLQATPVTSLDLTRIRRALELLADELSDDPAVVARHASRLQTLDIAAQLLRKLAAER